MGTTENHNIGHVHKWEAERDEKKKTIDQRGDKRNPRKRRGGTFQKNFALITKVVTTQPSSSGDEGTESAR